MTSNAALGILLLPLSLVAQTGGIPQPAPRPMSWVDVQSVSQVQTPVPSPDGKWALYVLSTPDWKNARRQSDIYLVSTTQGVASTRRLTYTAEKNETNPAWTRDGKFLVFSSDRDAPAANTATASRTSVLPTTGPGMQYLPQAAGIAGSAGTQLYLMRPDGGEARRITDARDGVSSYALSPDGQWLMYRSGNAGMEQLYSVSVTALEAGDAPPPLQLTHHATGIGMWRVAPDSKHIYFTAADANDPDERLRLEKRFDVRIRNAETPLYSLWSLDASTQQATRLTNDTSYSVGDMVISPDA